MDSEIHMNEIFAEDSIGGMVLEALTVGLYADNLNCIREYVQNSVDVDSKRVDINVENEKTITIEDDGRGMNRASLFEALKLGYSTKGDEQVGWRGIGIWSGVGLCSRLEIVSKMKGHPAAKVSIDCSMIKNRQNLRDGNLIDIMNSAVTDLGTEGEADDTQYTKVRLEGIPFSLAKSYCNKKEILNFVERTVPLRFRKSFENGKEILEMLARYGIAEPKTRVFVCGEEAFKVPGDSSQMLPSTIFEEFKDENGNVLAFGWFVSTNISKSLDYAELTLRKKGFRIGDTELVTTMARKKYRPWYHGEIHIISNAIVENSSRDGINRGPIEAEKLLFDLGAFSDKLEQLSHAISDNIKDATLKRAEKFIEKGKRIEARVELSKIDDKPNRGRISQTVADSFPKVSEDIKRAVFEENERLDSLNRSLGRTPERSTEAVGGTPVIPTSKRKTPIGSCKITPGSQRAINMFSELKGIRADIYPNASAILLRSFIEVSFDEYFEKFCGKISDKKLKILMDEVLKDLASQDLSRDENDKIRSDGEKIKKLVNDLNNITHNRYIHPERSMIVEGWDLVEPVISIMWSFVNGDRKHRDP